MKKIFIALCIILGIVLFYIKANAFYVSLNPSGSVDITGQATFQVEVWFYPDIDGNTFGNWQFSLLYDTSELTWNSSLTSYGTMPSPLLNDLWGTYSESTPGRIENFNALKFPPNASDASVSSPLLLVTVGFDVTGGTNVVSDAQPDVWFDTVTPSGDGFTVDGTAYFMYTGHSSGNIMPTSASNVDVYASTTVVPEPVSSALFIVGGATLGIGRIIRKREGKNTQGR